MTFHRKPEDLLCLLDLPGIPARLDPELGLESLLTSPDTYQIGPHFWINTVASSHIKSWLESLLDVTLKSCFFQIIHPGLHIHTDPGRNVALNYSYDAGGLVSTTQFSESGKVFFEQHVPEKQWYLVKTDVPHTVAGLERPRIALSTHFYTDDWSVVKALISSSRERLNGTVF